MLNYNIVILTYKRKKFRALKLLKDNSVKFTLAVRKEEYENGFYDELKDKFDFMLLENVTDAGNTRNEILRQCYFKGIEYCVMLDDTIDELYNDNNDSIKVCIEKSILEMQKHKYANNIIASQITEEKYRNVLKNIHSFIAQAFILNVKLAYENIHFRSISDCGYDDFTFSYESYKAGFYIINSSYCMKKCKNWKPVYAEAGGTHDLHIDIKKCCEINDLRWLKTYVFLSKKYITNDILFGIREENGYKFCKLKLSLR